MKRIAYHIKFKEIIGVGNLLGSKVELVSNVIRMVDEIDTRFTFPDISNMSIKKCQFRHAKNIWISTIVLSIQLKNAFFCQELVQIGGKNNMNWFTKFTAFYNFVSTELKKINYCDYVKVAVNLKQFGVLVEIC